MCRCPIVVFLDFSGCLLIKVSVRTDQVFRKLFWLIALMRLAVGGLKISSCKYWASSGFEVLIECCLPHFVIFVAQRGTSHIPVFLFLVSLIISSPLLWMDISCLSIMMVHPPSHITPNHINLDVFNFGKMWICLNCLIILGIWNIAMFVESIVLPSGSLDFISFSIIIGAFVGAPYFARCIFAPASTISSMLVLVG